MGSGLGYRQTVHTRFYSHQGLLDQVEGDQTSPLCFGRLLRRNSVVSSTSQCNLWTREWERGKTSPIPPMSWTRETLGVVGFPRVLSQGAPNFSLRSCTPTCIKNGPWECFWPPTVKMSCYRLTLCWHLTTSTLSTSLAHRGWCTVPFLWTQKTSESWWKSQSPSHRPNVRTVKGVLHLSRPSFSFYDLLSKPTVTDTIIKDLI